MTTEEFFATLLRYAQDQESPETASSAIMANLALSEERHRQFQTDFPEGSLELSAELRKALDEGFRDYLRVLTALSQELSSETATRALPELQQAVRKIRTAQMEHQQNLAEGPTMLPYLNRFLLYYNHARSGGDKEGLVKVLSEYATFLQWLSKELARREIDPAINALVFQLRGFFSSVERGLAAGEELPAVAEDITELGQVLSEALSAETTGGQQGPTQIPAINQLFEALATLTGDHEEMGYIMSLIAQCRRYMRATCPTRSSADIIKGLGVVLGRLEQMERIFEGREGFEALEECAEQLEHETNRLFALVQQQTQSEKFESPLFEEHTEGLPPFYKSLLLPAYRMVEAGGQPEQVEAAADFLEASSEHYQSLLAQLDSEDSKLSLEESLASARDAASLMRALAEEGNPALLPLISMHCRQSTEKLREAGVPLR